MQALLDQLKKTVHGFKHIIAAGDTLLADKRLQPYELAKDFITDDSYQVRMLGTYLVGQLSNTYPDALLLLKTKVATDDNWRVQEMLAKAFDHYCSINGYEQSLPLIKEWLADKNPNVKRAVIEGLRIWTSRSYFKEHPIVAIRLISEHKADTSEYVRKSTGNALRDISRKYPQEVKEETSKWDLTNKEVAFTYKLVYK